MFGGGQQAPQQQQQGGQIHVLVSNSKKQFDQGGLTSGLKSIAKGAMNAVGGSGTSGGGGIVRVSMSWGQGSPDLADLEVQKHFGHFRHSVHAEEHSPSSNGWGRRRRRPAGRR